MTWFFESNSPAARVMRTIVQGVIGVIISYLSIVAVNAPEIVSLLIIPIVMAILSPIMGWIGGLETKSEPEDDPKIGGTE